MAALGKTVADEQLPAHPPRSISRQALYELVWTKPLTLVAEDLGMTRNGLAKICDRLLIPYAGRGYWAKAVAGKAAEPPPLPAPPPDSQEIVVIAPGRSRSRRPRARLPRDIRSEQLIDAARPIIAKEGLSAVTMKRLAREIGMSEAQAHNHFRRRTDLLVALARRELAVMNAIRVGEVARGTNNLTRVTLSTIAYLHQVAERGVLIQILLNSPDVRAGLRAEREAQVTSARKRMTERLTTQYKVDGDLAYGATQILTSVALRAGRLLAERKIPLELAERVSVAVITAGNRRMAGRNRPA